MAKSTTTAATLTAKIEATQRELRGLELESPRRSTYAANRKLLVERLRVARKRLAELSDTAEREVMAHQGFETETTLAESGPAVLTGEPVTVTLAPVVDEAAIEAALAPTQTAETAEENQMPKTATPTTARKKKAERKSRAMNRSVPAKDRRLALVTLLRTLKATSHQSARTVNELAEKLKYNPYDVYCMVYHKYHLATDGFVKTFKEDGGREVKVFLTAKGVKNDPE